MKNFERMQICNFGCTSDCSKNDFLGNSPTTTAIREAMLEGD